MNITLSKNDEIVMKLIHYFITEQGYNPIVLHGAKDEIWLENSENEYQIVRIVTNYIHNDEQFDFDLYRTRQILKRIKQKTFSFKMNALSIFINLGENVHLEDMETENIDCIEIKEIDDTKSSEKRKLNKSDSLLFSIQYSKRSSRYSHLLFAPPLQPYVIGNPNCVEISHNVGPLKYGNEIFIFPFGDEVEISPKSTSPSKIAKIFFVLNS